MDELNVNKPKLKIGTIVTYILLTIIAIYTLSPLYILFVNSFKPQADIVSAPLALPSTWDFSYIKNAMESINFLPALWNTTYITVLSVTLIILSSSLAAWILVRYKGAASNFVFLFFTAAMLVPFQAIMFPLTTFFESLGLRNMQGLIIMYGGFGLSLSVFLYHGFIKAIPLSIEEAGFIDGANIFQLFFLIVFPLLKSITVTVIILNSMWIWNDYLLPFRVIGLSKGVKTLTLELYFAKMQSGQYGNPWELVFPAVFVSIIPIIIIFLSLQKYFVKGVSDGAVKS